jgi:hypothetical protein
LQPRKYQFKKSANYNHSGTQRHINEEYLPTTPFTYNELQSLNQENQAFKARIKKEFNLNNVIEHLKRNKNSN